MKTIVSYEFRGVGGTEVGVFMTCEGHTGNLPNIGGIIEVGTDKTNVRLSVRGLSTNISTNSGI
jgi:hypothetical protein